MAASLTGFDISQLAPGQNIFEFVEESLSKALFPPIPTAFRIQSYCAVAALCLFLVGMTSVLVLNFRKRRFSLSHQDGSATRPSLETVVPLLWMVESCTLIALAFWMTRTLSSPQTTGPMAFFLWLTPLFLFASYALVTINVIASAPGARRFLIKMNDNSNFRRRYTLTIIWILMCACMTASIIPGALETKRKSDAIYVNYLDCMGIIKNAKAANNLSMLVQLTDKAAIFQNLSDEVLTAIRNTALVYTAYCLLFCLGSLVPSIALNRAIMRKMAILRDASQSRSSFGLRPSEGAPEYKVKLQPTPAARHSLFPVMKDRPFANTIVIETPALPARFQAILDAKTQSTAERAGQLRVRLREENRYLVIYLVMLLMLSSYSLFEALGGQRKIPPEQWAPVGFYWMVNTFILAAFLVLGLAVWHALRARPDDAAANQETDLQVLDSRQTHRGVSGIQMQQQVLYTEEIQVEKEKEFIEPMSPTMLKIYTSAERAFAAGTR